MDADTSRTRTFPGWEGLSIDELLYRCRELVEEPDFPTVRRWRDAGGRVVGHFQVYFPVLDREEHAVGRARVARADRPVRHASHL